MGTTHTPPTARTAEDARLRPVVGDTYTNAIGMTFKVIALDDVEVRLRDADGDECHFWYLDVWSTPCVGGGTWTPAPEVPAKRTAEDARYAPIVGDVCVRPDGTVREVTCVLDGTWLSVRGTDADGTMRRTAWAAGPGTWRAAGGDTGPTGDALETACAAFEVARRAVEDAFYAEVERDAATRGVRVEYYPWDGYHAVQAVVVGAFKGTVTVEFNVLARGWRVTSMYSGAWHTTLADAWVAAEAAYAAWGAL